MALAARFNCVALYFSIRKKVDNNCVCAEGKEANEM